MKILKVTLVALSAVMIVGCGQKPKLPEGTVVAAYVDLQKVYASGRDVADMVIDNLPKTFKVEGDEIAVREQAEKGYKEGLKKLEEALKEEGRKPEDFMWVIVSVADLERAVSGNTEPSLALACRVAGLEKLPDVFKPSNKNIGGEAAYRGMDPFPYVLLYKQCILAASTESALENLLLTYKGEKPSSSKFDDLMALESETVARFQVAGLADFYKTVKIPMPNGEKKTIAEALKIAFQGIDEDMGEYLAELEGVKLDFNLVRDNLGFAFSVVCGSSAAAKLAEQIFGTAAILARFSADCMAVALREGTTQMLSMLPRDVRKLAKGDTLKIVRESDLMKTLVTTISGFGQKLEVERDGDVATIRLAVPLDDVVADVIDDSVKVAEKVMAK